MTIKNRRIISVIVPILNEEKNIPVLYDRLVKSLTPYKYELIFVNDGSQDGSEKAVNKLLRTDTSVKLI